MDWILALIAIMLVILAIMLIVGVIALIIIVTRLIAEVVDRWGTPERIGVGNVQEHLYTEEELVILPVGKVLTPMLDEASYELVIGFGDRTHRVTVEEDTYRAIADYSRVRVVYQEGRSGRYYVCRLADWN